MNKLGLEERASLSESRIKDANDVIHDLQRQINNQIARLNSLLRKQIKEITADLTDGDIYYYNKGNFYKVNLRVKKKDITKTPSINEVNFIGA